MVELFLNMPMWLQIFCAVAMVIGLIVIWRFRKIFMVVAAGAIAIFLSLKSKKSDK